MDDELCTMYTLSKVIEKYRCSYRTRQVVTNLRITKFKGCWKHKKYTWRNAGQVIKLDVKKYFYIYDSTKNIEN